MLSIIQEQICDTQAELFELAVKRKYNIYDFTKQYLKSHFANKEMDSRYSFYHCADAEDCMDNLLREFTPKIGLGLNEVDVPPSVAYWIGYILRQLVLTLNLKSSELAEIDLNRLMLFIPVAESEDEEYLIERIKVNLLGLKRL